MPPGGGSTGIPMHTNKGSGLLALACAFALAGCSAGPSKADAQKAIEAEFSRMFGAALQGVEIQGFEMAGCRKAKAADGYACDVTGKVVLNIAGTQQVRPLQGNLRFRRDGGGWKVYEK